MQKRNKNCWLEEDVSNLLNFISDSAMIVSHKGKVLATNKGVGAFVGTDTQKIVGKNLADLDFLDKTALALIQKQLKRRLAGEYVEDYEIPVSTKGEIKYVEPKGSKIAFFGKPADLIILHDVTQRKHIEEALQTNLETKNADLMESEERFRGIFNSSPDAITLFDKDGTIIDCNQATVNLHGFSSKQELIGKNAFRLIAQTDHKTASEVMKKLPEIGMIGNLEFTFLTKDGKEFPAEGSAAIIKDAFGGLKGFVSITKNIAERKQYENMLKERLEIEKVISRISSSFVSTVNIDSAIDYSLAEVGGLCKASRSYLFLFDERNNTMSNIYEWCADGVTPQKDNLQSLSIESFPWWMKKLRNGEVIHVADVSKMLEEARTERETFEKQGIKSLIILPIYLENKLGGFAGFDNVESIGNWSQKNIGVLRIYSEIVSAALEKTRSSNALRKSEERFADIASNINEWVWEVDSEGRYVYSNASVRQILGYEPEETVGKHFYDFFLPEEKEQLKKAAFKAFSARERFVGFINRNVRKDGSIVYLETSGVPVFDTKGQFTGYRGADHDITYRKKAMETLAASEEKYRKLFEASIDAIIIADAETGIIVDCNAATLSLVGWEKSELIGQHQSLIHPKAPMVGGFTKGFKEHIEDPTRSLDTQVVTKTGEVKDVSVKASVFELKGKKLMQGTFRDITENKLIEQVLKASEEKYRELINGMNDTAWVIDFDANFIDINDAAMRVLGYSREELLSMGPADIDHSLSRDQIKELARRMPADHVQIFETSHTAKNGKTIPVEISSSIVTYQGKRAILSIARDITERKVMRKALEENEEKFQGIANSVRDAIILVDEKAMVTYWNPAAEKTFGYSNTEAIGKEVHKLVVPKYMCKEAADYICSQVKAFGRTGMGNFTLGAIEVVGSRKDGSEFPAKLSISPVKLGEKWHAVGVVKDTTQRKHEEQALREAEQRYHALFDQAPLGIVVVDPETVKLVEFNDVACKQLGYSREEFANLTISEIEAKETAAEVKSHTTQMAREGGGEFETKHRKKGGDVRNVLVSTRPIDFQGKKFLHCIFHDITEIRRVQNALIESETKYRQLVELAQEGIWALNNGYVTTFVNPRMADMLGHSQASMVGKSLFEFIDNSKIDQASTYLTSNTEISGHFQFEFKRKNGTPISVSIAASPIKNDEGVKVGNLALIADVTEQESLRKNLQKYSKSLEALVKQRTKQLEEAQEKLLKSERLAAIGELAGMVGHDLRNPLTGIKNAVYFLEKKGADIPRAQAKEMLQTIDNCIERSNKIINDLLDYSREIHLKRKVTSPRKLLSETLAMVHVPENVLVLTNLSDQPQISLDDEKIERVFINLIKNAADAMPTGGKLTINAKQTDGEIRFSFADTGVGISDEVMPKLFSPLVTTKAQGMGFGLAICKRIVEAHGGTITVKTAKGKGATFMVTLPVEPKQEVEGKKIWINVPESLLLATTKA